MEVPWWTLSPSPFSIIFYLILIVYTFKKIRYIKQNPTRNKKFWYITKLTDAFFIVGFVVVTMDTLWIVVCGLRFGWFYPDSVLQLILCAGRNLAALVLCYFAIGNYFHDGTIKFRKTTVMLYLLNVAFLTTWFLLSPTPAYTDYTYAIRHDYPMTTVLISFMISHVVGKSVVALTFLSLFLPESTHNTVSAITHFFVS